MAKTPINRPVGRPNSGRTRATVRIANTTRAQIDRRVAMSGRSFPEELETLIEQALKDDVYGQLAALINVQGKELIAMRKALEAYRADQTRLAEELTKQGQERAALLAVFSELARPKVSS
jgi:hypothetical protein